MQPVEPPHMPLQETGSALMGRRNKPPGWQEGSHQFEVVLPADKSKSGKEETVCVGFSRIVVATDPMNARRRTGGKLTWVNRRLMLMPSTVPVHSCGMRDILTSLVSFLQTE